ncbi:unannotated protein [freshwater metagenome]|uniref:Unannotated protein n=1 Tax=freshwater metagenome TaxID=449393 RepID=A0A6J7GDN3_9ZZZZ|nr:hypothetical protein [Actinomycetota bacterium]
MPLNLSGRGDSAAKTIVHHLAKLGDDVATRVRGKDGDPDARRSLIVGRGADEVRAVWSDPVRLGRIMAEPYTGHPSTWTAEITEADGEEVRFRARSGQTEPLHADGVVSFGPAQQDLGTTVTLQLRVEGPDLAAGATAAKALRRAKALIETGEIPTLAHNVSARHATTGQEA